MQTIINIASYKFVKIEAVEELKTQLLNFFNQSTIKGSVYLATEGINLNLAGTRSQIDAFIAFIRHFPIFEDMFFKESFSTSQPFRKLQVKIKKELVPTGQPQLQPCEHDLRVAPVQLKQWLDEGAVTLLDTRNAFEFEMGSFEGAIHLGLEHFRDFSAALKQLDPILKKKPVVIFCTGGIRCEKAGPLMTQAGFEQVYQLDGGILTYFEQCGGAHYRGECFVFDERIALNPDLS